MKRFWMVPAIAVLVLVAACGPTPEPTMNPADVQGTAMAVALTMVSETQAAMPTATAFPPTEAPTATPFPTNTVPPLSLASPTQLPQAVAALPTNTSVPASGSGDGLCNKTLSAWDGESASLSITNKTKPKGAMTISLYVLTPLGECGYISGSFQDGGKMTIPIGSYSAWAIVNSKKSFTAGTSFVITRSANYQLVVEQERVYFTAGCTPDC